ncbi:MAG: acyloxyacyl hydrolase [Sphingomonas bacterium]|nr:acyloxyacyl hydrolase [Sphingomonas bacterium]
MKASILSGVAIAIAIAASPAQAGEVFGGLYVHGVDTPLSLGGSPEGGFDGQLGYRGDPIIVGTGLEPYVFGALNSSGDTNYAAAGLSWKFGDRIYVRPGLGIAVHTGSARDTDNPFNDKIEFGSRVLFAPEVGIGARISERATVEASWIHLSHATLFGKQNPGIDNIGVRLNWKL